MKQYFKDPLLLVSVLLAITGGLQASQGLLSEAIKQHPIGFGIAMTITSCVTGALTVLKTALAQRPSPNTHDDGTAGESQ